MLCFDILDIIFHYISFNSQHRLKLIHKETQKLSVTNFYDVEPQHMYHFENRILQNYKNIRKIKLIEKNVDYEHIKFVTKLQLLQSTIANIPDDLTSVVVREDNTPLLKAKLFNITDLQILSHNLDTIRIIESSNLRKLDISLFYARNVDLITITLNDLKELSIRRCEEIIFITPNLTKLILRSCYNSFTSEYVNSLHNLEYLDVKCCVNYDTSLLTNLKTLIAHENIDNHQLNSLGLEHLEVHSDMVTNIDHLINLTFLKTNNSNISYVNHLTNLTFLDITYSNVTNIDHLTKLKSLCCDFHVKNILNVMTNLTSLQIFHYDQNIDDRINNFTNLEVLQIYGCIITCDLMLPTLRNLALYSSTINDSQLNNLTNLEKLTMSDQKYISFLNHLTKLKSLEIKGVNCIDNDSISKLSNIEELEITGKYKINCLTHLPNLKFLRLNGYCSIDVDDIVSHKKLKTFDILMNQNIDNIYERLECREIVYYNDEPNFFHRNIYNFKKNVMVITLHPERIIKNIISRPMYFIIFFTILCLVIIMIILRSLNLKHII